MPQPSSRKPTLTRDGAVEIPSYRATVHQPADVLELARLTLDAAPDDNHLATIGSLPANRVMFATVALPGHITIAGDVHVPRLFGG